METKWQMGSRPSNFSFLRRHPFLERAVPVMRRPQSTPPPSLPSTLPAAVPDPRDKHIFWGQCPAMLRRLDDMPEGCYGPMLLSGCSNTGSGGVAANTASICHATKTRSFFPTNRVRRQPLVQILVLEGGLLRTCQLTPSVSDDHSLASPSSKPKPSPLPVPPSLYSYLSAEGLLCVKICRPVHICTCLERSQSEIPIRKLPQDPTRLSHPPTRSTPTPHITLSLLIVSLRVSPAYLR